MAPKAAAAKKKVAKKQRVKVAKKVKRSDPKFSTLRKSITPGTIAVMLAGRFRGRRVVVLKQLPKNGPLVISGPMKYNGVPLRRVDSRYIIATSTKVDISGVDTSKVTAETFKRAKAEKRVKSEGDFMGDKAKKAAQEKAKKTSKAKKASANVSAERSALQKAVDSALIAAIKKDLGQVDCVIYSLASPRRTHPKTGEVLKSVLKPIGESYTNKNLNTGNGVVNEITIDPANEDEIAQTVAVMGGEDWEMWMQALSEAGLLAPGAQSVAYSYIGPEVTWAIYKNGTIGLAKNDLERAARNIDSLLKLNGGGRAFISVNKALVTQASSAIPVVPLYISILYKIMKAAGTHEGCIEQIQRLFATQMYGGNSPRFDETGRVRIDDWEMRPEIQAAVRDIWPRVTTENLAALTDIAGYRAEFLKLFGFGLPGIDYEAEAEPHLAML